MFGRSSTEKLLRKIATLDTVEFLGVCKILDIKLYELDVDLENEVGIKPRHFADIWSDLCDKVNGLNRTRRKNLNKLVSAATQKEE